ncbi:MAG: AmmeMemoRadiSam system protein B [Limisphaerales bacterium]
MSQASIDIELKGVRRAAVAGQFYPADPEELASSVKSLLADAPRSAGPAPKALIVPHAGYMFSGPIAASGYARLAPARERIKRVVLLGPSHRVAFEGVATVSASAFATPLGLVPVDAEGLGQLASAGRVSVNDEAHAHEHALEVQLPFLQTVLADFALVPLLVWKAEPEAISQVLEAAWGGAETCIIISSDLSHYHSAALADEMDSATAAAIEALSPEGIGEDGACGRWPICGLLQAARRQGLRARTLVLRNSGDAGGPRQRVVGYGAFVFEEGTGR